MIGRPRSRLNMSGGAQDVKETAKEIAVETINRISDNLGEQKRSHYMGSFGKSAQKCIALVAWLDGEDVSESDQLSLF